MERRELGRSGLKIAPLVFGGNVFGWTADEATSFALLDAFVAAGFDCIDTADVYSRWVPGHTGGESETVIGKWLARSGNRDKVVIITKVGMQPGPDGKGLSRETILRGAEASLTRLQTDYIDMYMSHADDPVTPFEETFEAYGQLLEAGKIRSLGASNYAADRLEMALATGRHMGSPGYQCLEPLYNLYERMEYETELEPVCRREGLGVITYFSLASGFLTGKHRTWEAASTTKRGPFLQKYFDARGLRILAALDQVANELGVSPATVSLAWLLARDTVTAPIASATSLEQLQALIQAAQLQLPPDAVALLNKASAY